MAGISTRHGSEAMVDLGGKAGPLWSLDEDSSNVVVTAGLLCI